MSVYVDQITDYGNLVRGAARRWGTRWSHMFADTEEELHVMASRLGLRRSYFQPALRSSPHTAHYDIIPAKRRLAIQYGAQEISGLEWARRHRTREEPRP